MFRVMQLVHYPGKDGVWETVYKSESRAGAIGVLYMKRQQGHTVKLESR